MTFGCGPNRMATAAGCTANKRVVVAVVLAVLVALALTGCPSTNTQTARTLTSDYSGDWHLVLKPVGVVTASYSEDVRVPSLNPTAWIVVVSIPPSLQAQRPIESGLTLMGSSGPISSSELSESNGLERTHREAVFPPGQSVYPDGFSVKAVYGVQLFSRDLETGAVTDPDSVPSLPIADKQQYLAPNSHISWSKGPIHDWMIQRNLTIQGGESFIAFAWRVSQAIRQDLWTRMEFL